MFAERHSVTLLTDGSGNAEAWSPVVTGRLLAVHYVKPGAGGFDNGVDFDVTIESTGEAVWSQDDVNASAAVYPRAQVHDTAGAGATYDGTAKVLEPVTLANDRVKIAVAQGGSAKSGTFLLIVG